MTAARSTDLPPVPSKPLVFGEVTLRFVRTVPGEPAGRGDGRDRAAAQAGGELHQQVDVLREQWVRLEELLLGDAEARADDFAFEDSLRSF